MTIRLGFGAIFALLIAAVIFCAVRGIKSGKRIGRAVGWVNFATIIPLIGNLIIIGSTIKEIAIVGCYLYYIGMDMVMASMVFFTSVYCKGIGNGQQRPTVMYVILGVDAVQLLLNTIFGHAFTIEPVDVHGYVYYRMIPFWGQNIHRIIDYGVFFCVMLIFIIAIIKTVKLYRERYSIVLLGMLIIAFWQTFYIFSRTPVDRSMIGYGVFGLLVYYLALHYRPLRLLDRLLSDIVSNMNEALFVYDAYGRCLWMNETGSRLLDLKNDYTENVPAGLKKMFGDREYTKEEWSENKILGSGEDARYYTIENHNVNEDKKHLAGSYLVVRDNTEEKRRLKSELYKSTHDSLTGLYTKQYLYQCISVLLHEDRETEYSIVFVDVKNFKIVNDIFGSDFGDLALMQISEWLSTNVNEKCRYGRIAGDTFGVLIPTEKLKADRQKVEDELLNFTVSSNGLEHRLLIHIGVYEVDDRDMDVSVMFDRAHLALSAITGNYKEHIACYDKDMRKKVVWDQQITAGLSEAISKHQIMPYLQPITNRSGKVVGAEALARWIHPQNGFMSPAVFIPILEKNGLIVEVDRHIWRCACEILSSWKKQGNDMFISINISPKNFYYIDVVSEIKALVEEYDIEPKKLRIEITETVMMNDAQEKFKLLDELRNDGFIVEMDDFGSGYSSLNLLKDMPVDVLKIDMKFLSSSDNDEKARTIIRNIIQLSEDLHITSLTEGVETVEQYSELSQIGCKLFQGYYFAKPLPRKEFEEYAFPRAS